MDHLGIEAMSMKVGEVNCAVKHLPVRRNGDPPVSPRRRTCEVNRTCGGPGGATPADPRGRGGRTDGKPPPAAARPKPPPNRAPSGERHLKVVILQKSHGQSTLWSAWAQIVLFYLVTFGDIS